MEEIGQMGHRFNLKQFVDIKKKYINETFGSSIIQYFIIYTFIKYRKYKNKIKICIIIYF
jgi:hypothetical protein